jgi:hypothetical protein
MIQSEEDVVGFVPTRALLAPDRYATTPFAPLRGAPLIMVFFECGGTSWHCRKSDQPGIALNEKAGPKVTQEDSGLLCVGRHRRNDTLGRIPTTMNCKQTNLLV